MADTIDFDRVFAGLTGNAPLSWQRRLFHDHFAKNDFPSVIDLPTGLGKTMVMAIWLIARAECRKIPTRLIYVVDRRTVVDQATDIAIQLKNNLARALPEFGELAISTLRGQLADNREWSRDPSKPAIIIGTVDLIGSALLFSGYRSGYKTRPLHAGLLGQDSLLVLDEAHLSKPFDKLVTSITAFQSCQGMPMQVVRMSATTKGDDTKRFKLETSDLPDSIVRERFEAAKTLKITTTDDPIKSIAAAAGDLAKAHPGSRIVVFVKSPKDVDLVCKALNQKEKVAFARIAMLTGTMRGLERDELVDLEKPILEHEHQRRVMQRFLTPDNDPSQGECFLISTSAGEVGFDLNADHMACDAAPLDSMIQRLGRVNRRGKGDASIRLILGSKPPDKRPIDQACIAASHLFTDGMDVSPQALALFKSSLTTDVLHSASTPEPTTVELTDILLDSWSMTSITAPMPGRPEVAPWIRGIADDLPQTTIAWRAELDLLKREPKPEKALTAIFGKHRIRPHESLTTNSYRVVEFLKAAVKVQSGRSDFLETRVVIKLSRSLVVKTVEQLISDAGILNADPTLILPATFGGLDKGTLSHEAIAMERKPDDPAPVSLDVADKPGYEARVGAPARLRVLIKRNNEGKWQALPLPGGMPIPPELSLMPAYDTSRQLFNALASEGRRIRLVQPIEFDEDGESDMSLVMLTPIRSLLKKERQLLTEHVAAVEAEVACIAENIGLTGIVRDALFFAAKWHDEGKKAEIWQKFVDGDVKNPLGKASSTRDPKSLRGYRHELGSMLRIHHPDRHETDGCVLPRDSETRDLALHMIGTHHGFGRPHFENTFVREFSDNERNDIHMEIIRRFAKLQRTKGHWHLAWLENLLRCADGLASADQEAEDDVTDDAANFAGGVK